TRIVRRPGPAHRDGDDAFAARAVTAEDEEKRELIGRVLDDVAKAADQIDGVREIVDEQSGRQRAQLVQAVEEARDDAEVSAAAAKRPEEIAVRVLVRKQHV